MRRQITTTALSLSLAISLASNLTYAESAYKSKELIALTFENDAIGSGSDRNYTNGFKLSYLNAERKPDGLSRAVAKLVPFFKAYESTLTTYSFGQNLYTPKDITVSEFQPDDRPWAAFLYGSISLSNKDLDKNHLDIMELSIGVVGPNAYGEDVQKKVHEWTDSDDPKGWDNQIGNEVAFYINTTRVWTDVLEQRFLGLNWELEPHVGLALGTVYTFAETGFSFSISPYGEGQRESPIRVFPSTPGTGYFEQPRDGFSWYIYGGIQVRAVARNIFLDGNTFKDSHEVDKETLVADVNLGLALTFSRLRLSYSAVYRTKEYDIQDKESLFGAVNLTYLY